MPQVKNLSDLRFSEREFLKSGIRIDRQSKYGNPFIVGVDGDRNEVCDLFELYAAWRNKIQPDWLYLLHGEDLYCWCAPKRCHGLTLIRLANGNR